MSDDSFKSGYDYKSVSNLVLNVDSRTRGEIGPSSDVQSLAGRMSVQAMQRDMGSRAAQVTTDRAAAKAGKEQQRTRGKGDDSDPSKRLKTSHDGPASSFSSSPSGPSLSTSSLYRPQTKETRLVYDSLLSFLPTLLSTLSSHDVLTSAADELLLILKTPNLTPKQAQAEVESLLAIRISDDQLRTLVNLAQRITDFTGHATGEDGGGGVRGEKGATTMGVEGRDGKGGGEVDDRVGVSVVFNEDDEEEEEEEDDDGLDVIKDDESDLDEDADERVEGEDDDAALNPALHSKDAAVKDEEATRVDDDDIVQPSSSSSKAASSSSTSSSALDVRSIDAHWIQRQITAFTPDAITSQSLSSQVLASLSDVQLSDGAVETSLVSLLGFDRFGLIKQLTTNRWRLVYAIKLARTASDDEKEEVQREMKDNERAKGVYEELTGRTGLSHTAATPMDVESSTASPAVASSASRSSQRHTDAYWVKHSRSLLDLESLTFTSGSHQMSNAECKLPKGSEIFTKKNYQEVHIPALKPQPMGEDERLVRVDSMPAWAQPAFAGMTELNRIQSRVYDTALNSVDNMLVCAPTGAGKCFARSTQLRLYNGDVVAVEHIKGGMQLMGDDSLPRTVTPGSLVHDRAVLYTISPSWEGASPFTVNGDHILVLSNNQQPWVEEDRRRGLWLANWFEVDTTDNMMRLEQRAFTTEEVALDEVEELVRCWAPLEWDVSVESFLAASFDVRQACQLMAAEAVTFVNPQLPRLVTVLGSVLGCTASPAQVEWAAWFLGVWMAKGNAECARVTPGELSHEREQCDSEVSTELRRYAGLFGEAVTESSSHQFGCDVHFGEVGVDGGSAQSVAHRLLQAYGLSQHQHIPQAWVCDTLDVRRRILAGLIDGGGCCVERPTRGYEVTVELLAVAKGCRELLSSIGVRSGRVGRKMTIGQRTGRRRCAHRIFISGDTSSLAQHLVCSHLRHSQSGAAKHAQPNKNSRCYAFTIAEQGVDEYFGFTVHGGINQRFLLQDYTITHNTNVAMLCMLHEIGAYRSAVDGAVQLDRFKMVYIAPMKSLVQEMVLNFGQRLAAYGIKVAELSGDQQLSREQIEQTQLIITTPEKWDIITRKAGDRAYTSLVKLVILDEIHLLHDDRGPVLESIVTRTIRQIETEQEMVRLVGLSATLPNYEDVAMFLRVNPARGLFFFDNSFRPVPLQQCYIGITQKKAFKRMQMMNDVCYEKVMAVAGKQQVIIFVHSRKDTATTARMIRDRAQEADELVRFIRDDEAGRKEILRVETENVSSSALKDLLPHGFGIHHAGMTRKDRTLVEDLFAGGHLQVLVSTATLAWGVNLPAHTVIIKGTQVYEPAKGEWQELSHLDVMQMLGRAGRPQYDKAGEGVIITSHKELQYYLSLLNQQLPVESQFISTLPDQLNAEVVAGSVTSMKDAVEWLGYTYLYVRMLRRPLLYGISVEQVHADPYLEQRRVDLIHTAATVLDKHQLIRYDRKTATLSATDLGRVASHYYLTHHSVAVYNEHLRSAMSDIELFRLFSLSNEFKQLGVREEEKVELAKLLDKVPIPVRESIDERSAKVNVLLQAYISRLSLEGFALMSDLVYITQSAGRISRALFEIVLRRGWSSLAIRVLTLAKMIERQCWEAQSPLRQFPHLPIDSVKKLEGKDLTFAQLLDLDAPAIGDLLRNSKLGVSFYKAIHYLPHLELSGHVQPITRTTLRIELTITADFSWNERYHRQAEAFWVLVEDVDGETLLHHELFLLRKQQAQQEHTLTFTVPIFDPLPPQYFIRVVSDRWLGCDISLPISFRRLLLPEKFSPPTELLDLQPLTTLELASERFLSFFGSRLRTFNPIQTQVFHAVYRKADNVFVAAPVASGKTNVIAELAILQSLSEHPDGRIVYVTPLTVLAEERDREWKQRFRPYQVKIARLTGDVTLDARTLTDAQLIVATPREWESLTRRWKNRAVIKDGLTLCIFDDLHLLGGEDGAYLEVAVSRTRYIQTQLAHKRLRLLGLAASIANARDVGEWMGCSSSCLFNFHPNVRPLPLEIRIHGMDVFDYHARQMAMVKPAFRSLQSQSHGKPVLMFTSDAKQTKQLALALTTLIAASDDPQQLIKGPKDALDRSLQDASFTPGALLTSLTHGIGYLVVGMDVQHRAAVIRLYREGSIRLVLLDHSLCYGLREQLSAYLVMVMGTQYYNPALHAHADIPLTSILQMTGYACRPLVDSSSALILFTANNRKELYKRFLYQPFPVESQLQHHLAEVLIHEVISRRVETVQEAIDYLTWSFLYRRLTLNPNYYALSGVSHQHVSDYLSELVEQTVDDLKEAAMLSVDDEDEQHQLGLSILNLGMITSFYNLHYTTVEIFHRSLKQQSKLKAILDILAAATEFDGLYVRDKEQELLAALARRLPLAVLSGDYADAHVKAGVLIQCHLSRDVPVRFVAEVSRVLEALPRLMMAMVDVLSSSGWLLPALAVMELSQMVVQAMWSKDSSLKQLPHFTPDLIARAHDVDVHSIPDILELDDDVRTKLLSSLSQQQLQDVARVCNAYPDLELSFVTESEESGKGGKADVVRCKQGQSVQVTVRLKRDSEEEEAGGGGVPVVHSAYFPHVKTEGWWVVVGSVERNELVGIKRVAMAKHEMSVTLECAATVSGEYDWTLLLMCDSWMGVDQEHKIRMHVQENTDMQEEQVDERKMDG